MTELCCTDNSLGFRVVGIGVLLGLYWVYVGVILAL